jgi:hypothetical protein
VTFVKISMTRIISSAAIASIIFLSSCSKENLSNSDVAKIFKDQNVYPNVVKAKIFINEEVSAKRIADTNLDEDGYLKVQLQHTSEDIGKSLVHFTEKAKPYMISKADSIESIEIQLVRVGEETFSEVNDIQYAKEGTEAVVDYTVKVEKLTPFAVLLPVPLGDVQKYRTKFSLTNGDWIWNGNPIPIK